MSRFETDGNLLFGLLALQTGLIDQTTLITAIRICTEAKTKSLADILDEQGAIDVEGKALIQTLASRHLGTHGGDVQEPPFGGGRAKDTGDSDAAR